jgi:arsenite/tail-anchored protein-transporting ATPase
LLSHLLTLGARLTFVAGKGGVGKTTAAAALAVELADGGEPVLVLSVDPAHSLADALGTGLGDEPRPVPGVAGLRAMEVDADRERRRFLEANGEAVRALLERGTYLDRADVDEVLGLAVPGIDELAALLRLVELAGEGEERVVVDTAPTGHTLRLLELPRLLEGWIEALRAMDEKHRAVALALAGSSPEDAPARFLASLAADVARLDARLRDPELTRFLLVTGAHPVVLAETRRYHDSLSRMGMALGGIVVNRAGEVRGAGAGPGMVFVPALRPEPTGPEGLRRFAAAARPGPPGAAAATGDAGAEGPVVGPRFEPPADRRWYIVGGKGGVGKTTAACALALRLAAGARRVLLLSSDPAGSLGDVLGTPVGGAAAAVPGAPGLLAQQVDAAAAWEAFRAGYREEAARLFEGLLGGASAPADRRVVERLVDLAPPGVDELVALMEVVDASEDQPYDALVLDTAPTGHLLRLLEMPGAALEWTHTLLRLLLKYRELVPLGGLAERVLRLAHSLRALRERLADPAHTWFLAVALPEALSVPETARLLPRLRALGIRPGALLVNRALAGDAVRPGAQAAVSELLRLDPGLPGVAAPALGSGPVGAAALLDYLDGWRRLGS